MIEYIGRTAMLEQLAEEAAELAQAAIDALRVAYFDNNIQSAKDDPCIVDAMTDWAIRQVKALPSAQPEIIWRKDCKHWDGVDTCDVIDAPVWDNDFCSMAERRSNE